ncbi:MAG: NADP-dependent malic enzyme [Candidatus Nomurabacteria bacterium]|nr:NADP-dependent malic enzyme [Candidatus Nomurabacteria bacterium]
MKKNISKEALKLHKKLRGKIEIISKLKIKNKEDLSLIYTPGVADVSTYLANNKKETNNFTARGNMVAVISDGSAVLGLGNIGPEGALPVMEGKAAIFKSFADVDAFPIVLSTQNTEEIIQAIKAIAPSFGAINLEDISAPRCFEIEERLKKELNIPIMHDDQHGTAMVVLAGLINALKVCNNKNIEKNKNIKIIVNGSGAAGIAITKMLLEYGFAEIIVIDSHGAIYEGRENLNEEKIILSKKTNKQKIKGELVDIIKGSDVFIGVSKGGVLNSEMIKSMNKKPIIFALANPIPEIMPDIAKKAGAFIVATGRSDFPNQLNNALGFPGIFRGALDHKVIDITDTMLVKASIALAKLVKNPTIDKIIPSIFDKNVAIVVSKAIK